VQYVLIKCDKEDLGCSICYDVFHMKKIGGTRTSSARTSNTAPREPWRTWVMTLLALGFAMLVITLLSKENKVILKNLESARKDLEGIKSTLVSGSQVMQKSSVSELRSSECNNNVGECLMYINDAYYPQGLGVVEGYYEAREVIDWDGNTVTCDAFVVTDGSKTLLEGFGRLADAGSGYIPRTADGAFLININFEDTVAGMTDEEVATVLASTEDDQLELHTFVYQPREGGAGVCQSPLAILEVE
jgi:hypothetical protein